MAQVKCCICGCQVEYEKATFLFRGSDGVMRYICPDCFMIMTSKEKTVRSKIGESSFLIAHSDTELYEYLVDSGIVEASTMPGVQKETVCQISGDAQTIQTFEKTSPTSWITMIRTVMWLVIIVDIIASLAVGVTIVEVSPWIGFLVIIVGILLTLILNAAIMIFLDMADDIHAIRQKLNKM